MNPFVKYFSDFFKSLHSLLTGMATTLKIFFRRKTTELYPEKRDTLYVSEQFRGRLEMVHTENNQHHCVACGICQMNCPNNTIRVESESVTNAEGKTEKVLTAYHYDLGKCLFCELCVRSCPHQAIHFVNKFENAVFTRGKLQMVLNRPGSSLMPKPAKPAAAHTDTNPAKPE